MGVSSFHRIWIKDFPTYFQLSLHFAEIGHEVLLKYDEIIFNSEIVKKDATKGLELVCSQQKSVESLVLHKCL